MSPFPPPPPPNPPGIILTFIGICTNLWADQPNAPFHEAWGKRVVMGNAADPPTLTGINLRYRFDPPVMPHIATLSFQQSQVLSIDGPKRFAASNGQLFTVLDGVRVTVNNPNAPPQQVREARCMPGLGSWIPNIAPGPAATTNDPLLAAGYFDFNVGTIFGYALASRAGAGVIQYTVETVNEPEIVLEPFDPNLARTTIRLTGDVPAAFEILNIPSIGEKDNDNDFILHYLVANQFPPTWPMDPELGPPCQVPLPDEPAILHRHGLRFDFGIGCSNSNIP